MENEISISFFFLGLLHPSGHHLQLQPAAERLGVGPLVQHAQSGHQCERSPSLGQEIVGIIGLKINYNLLEYIK